MNSIKFTYDKLESVKLGFSIFDIKILNAIKHFIRGKFGLIQVSELTKEEIELVMENRAGINKKNLNTICLHHQDQYS